MLTELQTMRNISIETHKQNENIKKIFPNLICHETLSTMHFSCFPQSISRKCFSFTKCRQIVKWKKTAIFTEIYLRYYIAVYAFLCFSCSFYAMLHSCPTIKKFKQKKMMHWRWINNTADRYYRVWISEYFQKLSTHLLACWLRAVLKSKKFHL